MAQPLDPNDLVSFRELLMANSIQVDAAVQLLIEKVSLHRMNFSPNLNGFNSPFKGKQQYTVSDKYDWVFDQSHRIRF